jgi:amidase
MRLLIACALCPCQAWQSATGTSRIGRVATFITRLYYPGSAGPRLAVKDLIDVRGVPTTAGCLAVAERAQPAAEDAACLAGARAAGAAIVGKANLHELAFGGAGTNQWYGTPVNPLDPGLLPGGSSSGSAVAVADGEADYGYGTDTGGSVRIPSAFCGLTGLKTTYGRISTAGVWPLAPSFDTVGPIAAHVAGLAAAMALLEPGFTSGSRPAERLGRLRPPAEGADPEIDAAIDAALHRSGLEIVDVRLPDWPIALAHTYALLDNEAAVANAALLADPASDGKISAAVRARLELGAAVPAEQVRVAREFRPAWRARLAALLDSVDALVLPTVAFFPPPLAEAGQHNFTQLTAPINLAGLPALALPVPSRRRLPASLQVVGPAYGEELLLATGAVLEAAAG